MGDGSYDARRSKTVKGKKIRYGHQGIDFCVSEGDSVHSHIQGHVTKIGYPYNPSSKTKGHLRYVEITDSKSRKHRFFYVTPCVKYGDLIKPAMKIGEAQDLDKIYKNMQNHVHYEVKINDSPINPTEFLS